MRRLASPYVVTLGTAGGPVWWTGPSPRAGISTAVVVEGHTYLVDAGTGAGRQLVRAGLPMASLRAIFLTHLHSDHTVDLASLAVFGVMRMPGDPAVPIPIIGPGARGTLPRPSPRKSTPLRPLFADEPTPGTERMFELLMRAHATDLNDRLHDTLRPTPLDWFRPHDIRLPSHLGYHPDNLPTPDMTPFVVYEDDVVRVTATLVLHPPMAPAFGFRFDTDAGAVVISGDTAPTPNLVRMAADADLLLHEAIDTTWVQNQYSQYLQTGDAALASATRDHHYAAHTTLPDAVQIAQDASVRALAVHHLVPGDVPTRVWVPKVDTFDGRFLVPSDLDVIPLRGH